jgi:hypothetical protein
LVICQVTISENKTRTEQWTPYFTQLILLNYENELCFFEKMGLATKKNTLWGKDPQTEADYPSAYLFIYNAGFHC